MNGLNNALLDLATQFEKYNVRGSFAKGNLIYPSSLPKSEELDYYFSNFNPVDVKIDTGMSPIKLIGLRDLMEGQAGYRWTIKNGKTVDLAKWNSESIVIGDDFGGGNPIIVNSSIAGSPVFTTDVGIEPLEIAGNFEDFIRALSGLIDIVYGSYHIFDVCDDDENVKEDFTNLLKTRISPILGEENFYKFHDYFYG